MRPESDGVGKTPKFPLSWELPEFDTHEFRERQSRHCICVFVLNEGERFRAQLERMKSLDTVADIIVADGGSNDGSVAPAAMRTAGVRALLVKTGSGRLSAQMRMALAYALIEGYEGCVVIDGNNKDDPAAVPSFIDALNLGFDHVQGSRYVPGGRGINTPAFRHYGVRLIHAPLISLAAGFRYTDTTNGFRAYSRRLLEDPRVAPFRNVFQAYELHYYLAIRSARLGFRCAELPVTRAYPATGPTPTRIRGFSGNAAVLRTLLKAAAGRWDPMT